MKKDGTLSAALFLRISAEDERRLDALAERIPIASKNAIAREAMRLGLSLLEEDPARLVAPRKNSSRPKKRGGQQ